MFEGITKRRKNPVVNFFGWAMLAIVCVIFVFIGFSPNSNFLGGGGAAAEVNGDAISLRDFKELVERLENQQKTPRDRDASRELQKNALNILVSRTLIVQKAQELNIFVSDNEVADAIMSIEPFFEDGQFSRLRYKSYLQQTRMTESQFEDKLRRDLIIQKMSSLIGYAANDINLMDDFDKKVDQAQLNVSYLMLQPEMIRKSPTKEEIDKFLTEKSKEVDNYFKAHSNEFSQQEQVRARHILIKAKDGNMDEALKKVKEVASEATAANFSELAKKYSEDPGSKTKGGDLGFFPRGRMVDEFEDVAFSGNVGEISAPVKTQFGYHLILVDEKKEATKTSFEEAKETIARKLWQKEIYDSLISEIEKKLADGKIDEVEPLLSTYGLSWKDTGFFSISKENIPGVGNSSEFLNVALTLNKEKPYSKRLVFNGDKAYAIRWKGAKLDASADKAFNQMDFFKKLMSQQRMNSMVQTWADSLKQEAKIRLNSDVIR
ncbi:MAG: SurA N-terminal domain-containing protein [Bdellovibrionales bacterium]|nr:SurA N-terminal domain-containing protein [Bdellovibrionales bacterium]